MKTIIIFLILTLTVFFTSCKKTEQQHKVTFEITFLNGPSTGNSSYIEVYTLPNYSDKKPYVDRFNLPQVWRYEYIGLKKGDLVHFLVRGQLSYFFEMKVFIDGVEKSYRKVKVSDNSYYDDHVEESRGLNDKSSHDTGIIEFTY